MSFFEEEWLPPTAEGYLGDENGYSHYSRIIDEEIPHLIKAFKETDILDHPVRAYIAFNAVCGNLRASCALNNKEEESTWRTFQDAVSQLLYSLDKPLTSAIVNRILTELRRGLKYPVVDPQNGFRAREYNAVINLYATVFIHQKNISPSKLKRGIKDINKGIKTRERSFAGNPIGLAKDGTLQYQLRALAGALANENTPSKVLVSFQLDSRPEIRKALLSNPSFPEEGRVVLALMA